MINHVDQLDLFETCVMCNPANCGCTPEECSPENRLCCLGMCKSEVTSDEINEILDEETTKETEHDVDVKLAIAFDGIRALTINVVEVLATYDRAEEDDENIFIPRPNIDRATAENLYNKLINIHDVLKTVRKNRRDKR